jgi:hypothetical protein
MDELGSENIGMTVFFHDNMFLSPTGVSWVALGASLGFYWDWL